MAHPAQFSYKMFGPPTASKFCVLVAGFPDTETSGWGGVVDSLAKDHRVACLAFPGFTRQTRDALPLLGHSWAALATGFDATIQQICAEEKRERFSLIAHDWGAFLCLSHSTSHPQRIERLVLFDVGMLKQIGLKQGAVIAFYQLWFAFAFLLSCIPVLGNILGNLFLAMFFYTPVNRWFGPCPYEKKTGAAAAAKDGSKVSPRMCYVYFRMWLSFLLRDGAPPPRFPSVPTLFLYGNNKRIMFHDKRFLDTLAGKAGCSSKAFNHGHWLQLNATEDVLRELSAFGV